MTILLTYYVVAQLGLLSSDTYFAIDYMLETTVELVSTASYLLIKLIKMLYQMAPSGSLNLLLISKNGNRLVQSAGNLIKRSSETIRQLSAKPSGDVVFNAWLAGIMDGDGNFDFRNNKGGKT